MKMSEVTLDIVKKHIGVSDEDDATISMYWTAAKAQALAYTGLTAEEADELPDVTVAALALCSDLYTYRNAAGETAALNPTVKMILDMHSRNLL